MIYPESFTKRILILSVGTSPQIVTEVIYALTVQRQQQGKPQFLPTQIVIVSTETGVQKAKEMLEGENGYYPQLLKDYALKNMPNQLEYSLITDEQGQALDDIRNSQDNGHAANSIANTIRKFASDKQSALHISLAGGRKTQGYYTGFALSLFGRQQDRMSHILVSDGYEGNPKFFYPTPYSQIVKGRKDNKEIDLDTSLGKVELADIPFVMLHDMVPQKYHTAQTLDISALVNQVRNQQIAAVNNDYLLHIDLPNKRVGVLDSYVDFSDQPLELTYLLMMALAKIDDQEFELPAEKRHTGKEFQKHAHNYAVAFSRSYLITKGKSSESAKKAVPDNFFFKDLESNEISEIHADELIDITHNKKKIKRPYLDQLSKDETSELIVKYTDKIHERRIKDEIRDILEKEWQLINISATETRFVSTFLEGNKGATGTYMPQRNSELKRLMAEEFIDPIVQQVVPSGGFSNSGKEQRGGNRSLLIDAERIKITYC